jgi:ElaB/YqjD/DUF883 family membrane-anchored ribosome-binding protein
MAGFFAKSNSWRAFAADADGNRENAMVDEAMERTERSSDQDTKGSERMSTSQEGMEKIQDKVRELEVAQATQAATLAGAQATQAAAHAGTWSTMLAGAAGLVVGMFLGMASVRAARR